MAEHLVNRKGYFSLERSYRDAQGKPRKHRLKYFGKRSPDWGKAVRGRGVNGVDWAQLERDELVRMESQEALAKLMEEAQRTDFKAATGLDLPKGSTDPTPIEKPASRTLADIDAAKVQTACEPAPQSHAVSQSSNSADTTSADTPDISSATDAPEGKEGSS